MTTAHPLWIGVGALLVAAGAAFGWLMLRLRSSERVLTFMQRDNARFREWLHLKPTDPVAFRRGIRAGFLVGTMWGFIGIAAGIIVAASKGF